jgi:ferredoxin
MPIIIKKENWKNDKHCEAVDSCPSGAISQKDLECPEIDKSKCLECGLCTQICPEIFEKKD